MTFETFDFDFNTAVLPAQVVRDLASCRFIEQRRNLVLAGPPGIGKSHIAQALGNEAARPASTSSSTKPTNCSNAWHRTASLQNERTFSQALSRRGTPHTRRFRL